MVTTSLLSSPAPIVPPTSESAVSWGAILAGAVAAAALSLILLILGVGLGLSSVSPWSFEGVSKETFGWTSAAWLTFTALAASGLGGYLAGRLRTRWTRIHGDETYFRDTAHGFVSWAVATLLTAGLLTSAIGGVLGAGAKVAGVTAGAAASTAGAAAAGVGSAVSAAPEGDLNYWVDSLFRNATTPGADAAGAPPAPPAAGAAPGNGPMDPAAPPPPPPPEPIEQWLSREDFSYLFMDCRGYGGMRDAPGAYTIDEIAPDALDLMTALGHERFSVAGHSMGGMAIERMAVLAPERIRGMVAIAPAPCGGIAYDAATRSLLEAAAVEGAGGWPRSHLQPCTDGAHLSAPLPAGHDGGPGRCRALPDERDAAGPGGGHGIVPERRVGSGMNGF